MLPLATVLSQRVVAGFVEHEERIEISMGIQTLLVPAIKTHPETECLVIEDGIGLSLIYRDRFK